jgi:hypothetical protein
MTATNLANQGQAASNNVTGNLLTSAAQQGQQINNAGAATASGYIGQGNAWSQGISGIGNNLMNLALINQLGKGQGAGGGGLSGWLTGSGE